MSRLEEDVNTIFVPKLLSDLLRRLEAVTSVLEKVPSKSGGEKD